MAITTTSITIKDGAGNSQSVASATDPAGLERQLVALDERGVAAYSASATFTPFATAAVTVASIKGSSTKTVRVKSITLSGHSTANAETTVLVQRTSALGTGGTSVAPTVAKLDSGNAAATAVVAHYTTAAQSGGTAVGGAARTTEFTTGVVTTPTITTPEVQIWPPPGAVQAPSLVLRGTADFIELQNGNGGNLSAGTVLTYTIVWEEDGS